VCDNEFSGEEGRQRGCEDLGFTIHSNSESQYDPFVASLSDQLETDYCVLAVVANTRIQNGFTGYEGLSGARLEFFFINKRILAEFLLLL